VAPLEGVSAHGAQGAPKSPTRVCVKVTGIGARVQL
jgi:hypothetical protein